MRGKVKLRRTVCKIAASVLALSLTAVSLPFHVSAEERADTMAVIHPKEYTGAMKNPLMGLTGKDFFVNTANDEYCLYDQTLDYMPWASMMMTYIPWDALENDESDTIEDIAEYCNQRWRGKDANGEWHSYEEYGIKVIPRVYLRFPTDFGTFYGLGGDHWPDDMKTGDFTSAQFDARLKRLIERLGKLWDNDPRVAYIQMGIDGTWGEQHGTSEPANLAKYFNDNFKNKQVQVRYYNKDRWKDYQFGQYNDSIGDLRTDPDKWPSCAIGGEPAYDYGSGAANIHGSCPHVTSMEREYTYNTANMIRKTHSVYLTWLGDNVYGTRWSDGGDQHGEGTGYYYQNKAALDEGAELLQKELGYRYVMSEFSYTKEVSPGGKLDVAFQVQNKGSAPMYYNWPVQVSLKDPDSGKVVWSDTFKEVDIREWQPGTGYTDFDKKTGKWSQSVLNYTNEPKTHTVEETFTLSDKVESGKDYVIQLAVLDPEGGNMPSLRFAMENYYKGGYHPMGYIGVGKTPETIELDPEEFDSLAVDTSLRYYTSDSDVQDSAVLKSVEITNDIWPVVLGTDGYDLTNLNVSGTNSDGKVHNLNAAQKTWTVEAGSDYAMVEGSVLKPLQEGEGTVAVTVDGVKSEPISFNVTADTGTISGTVVDKSDQPVAGAQVSLYADGKVYAEAFTKTDGTYSFTSVLTGSSYAIIVTKDTYRDGSVQDVEVSKGNTSIQDFTLVTATAGEFEDDFSNGADNWKGNGTGSFEVVDGEYVQQSKSDKNLWKTASSINGKQWDDAIYEVDIKCTNTSAADDTWGGFMFRRKNVSDISGASGYLVTWKKSGEIELLASDGKSSLKSMGKADAGVKDISIFHHLKLVTKGENIKIFVDDQPEPIIEVNCSDFAYPIYTIGYAAVGGCEKGWTYDNVRITPFMEPVTKDDLNAMIESAETKLASGVYTDDTIENLNKAIAEAKEVAGNTEATEAEISNSLTAVRDAYDALVTAYPITVESNEGGLVGDGSKEIKLLKREYKKLAITPDKGYYIESIQADGKDIAVTDPKGMDYVVKLITSDVHIKVVFAVIPVQNYTVTAITGEGGSITPESAIVAEGESATFTITPSEGYSIEDVKVDGVSVGTPSEYTIQNIIKDMKISAIFRPGDNQGDEDEITENENFEDSFEKGDGNWTVNAGTWEVTSENAYIQTLGENDELYSAMIKNKTWDNAVYEVSLQCTDISSSTEGWAGFMFRIQSQNENQKLNGYLAVVDGDGRLKLLKAGNIAETAGQPEELSMQDTSLGLSGRNALSNQKYTVLATTEELIADMGTLHKLKIENQGTRIRIFVDDETEARIDIEDTSYAQGFAGLAAFASPWKFADVKVVSEQSSEPEKKGYTITARCNEGGSITPASVEVEEGQSAEFTISPLEGYEIEDVRVDNTSVGTPTVYRMENIIKDMEITALFKKVSQPDEENPGETPDDGNQGGETPPDGGNQGDAIPPNDGGQGNEIPDDEKKETVKPSGKGDSEVKPGNKNASVKTGDAGELFFPSAAMVLSLIIILGGTIYIRKYRKC